MINLGVLGDWISGRPKWQQEALQILAKQGKLLEQHKVKLYDLCKGIIALPHTSENATHEEDSVSAVNTQVKIKIHELSGLEGIGSISSQKPLTFNHNGLAVVYGKNGTGKTSYVRFLKIITGNRFVILRTAVRRPQGF